MGQCKINAEKAGVSYFAWTNQIYSGFCKVLNRPSQTPTWTHTKDMVINYGKESVQVAMKNKPIQDALTQLVVYLLIMERPIVSRTKLHVRKLVIPVQIVLHFNI